MGRTKKPGFSGEGLNKRPWSPEEDKILCDNIKLHGEGRWGKVASKAGLNRCGRSCRLRWLNYLRPDIKRGNISHDEEDLILRLHKLLGNRWSLIAGRLPGRTDNEIKNYWNTVLRKKVEARSGPLKNHMSFNPDENKSFKVRTMAKAPLESKPRFTEVGKSPERDGIQTGIETSPVMGATALATEDYDLCDDCLPNVVELEFIPHFGGELWQDVEMGSYCNNAGFCQHFDDSVLLERGLYGSITESDQIQPLFGPDLGSLSTFFLS